MNNPASAFIFRALENEAQKSRFLVVENDPNDAFLITRALKNFGTCGESAVCRNPSEAKDYLRGAGMYSNREVYPLPNVILTDLRMGSESGMELVEWVREQAPPLRDLPIIILTGSASPLQFEAAEQVGANKVCRKPTRLDELQTLLRAIAAEYCR